MLKQAHIIILYTCKQSLQDLTVIEMAHAAVFTLTIPHVGLASLYWNAIQEQPILLFRLGTKNVRRWYITKLPPKHSYNSILTAYPSLSIYSVLDDQNSSVSYPPPSPVLRSKVMLSAPKCACVFQPSPSPVHLCMCISSAFSREQGQSSKLQIK